MLKIITDSLSLVQRLLVITSCENSQLLEGGVQTACAKWALGTSTMVIEDIPWRKDKLIVAMDRFSNIDNCSVL